MRFVCCLALGYRFKPFCAYDCSVCLSYVTRSYTIFRYRKKTRMDSDSTKPSILVPNHGSYFLSGEND